MNKIGFVILHYNAINETKDCVDSIIEKIDTPDFEIIIVDNFSPNKSGLLLKKNYKDKSHITVILNEKNLGFAKGNNIGFKHAKETLGCDYIVFLNNDTQLMQTDFCKIIADEFDRSSFAVLGPRIFTPKKSYSDNPGRNSIMSINELRIFRLKTQLHLFFNYLHLEDMYNFFLLLFGKLTFNNITSKRNNDHSLNRSENVQLHGCCLVFSPIYVSMFNGLYDRTFLFMEEEILYAQMMKANLKTVYNPNLKIYHNEDISTNSISNKKLLKRRLLYKNLLQSSKELKKIILTSIE